MILLMSKMAWARSRVDTGSTSGFNRNYVLRIFKITKTGFFVLVELCLGVSEVAESEFDINDKVFILPYQ